METTYSLNSDGQLVKTTTEVNSEVFSADLIKANIAQLTSQISDLLDEIQKNSDMMKQYITLWNTANPDNTLPDFTPSITREDVMSKISDIAPIDVVDSISNQVQSNTDVVAPVQPDVAPADINS